MSTNSSDRKLAAIMFADIVSYSRLMGTNEEEALKLLNDFESISAKIVPSYEGTIIKKNGDQLFCEFLSAKNAVDASLKLQKELSKYNDSRPKDYKLEVRIGIHIGDVVKREDGDIHGDGVNVAARIQPLASPGGICVSGAVSDAISSHPTYEVISKGEQELKNILQKHSIYQIKTGYEAIKPESKLISAKKTNNKIYWSLGIMTFLVLLISHNNQWWLGNKNIVENIEVNNNYYIHLTSNKDYIKYYKNLNSGSPFDDNFSSDRYIIASIEDSLLNEIKYSIFRSVSSDYANQEINIDISFSIEESFAFDKLYHPMINPLTDGQKDTLIEKIDTIISVLDEKYDNYNSILPNTIIRYFIYKITDLEEDIEFYAYQGAYHWGESIRTHSSTQYGSWSSGYEIENKGYDDLVNDLSSAAKGKIYEREHGGGIAGEVIEELDHGLVRIRQYHPGIIKKKMKIASMREYVWLEGGLDILIEDLMLYINYFKKTDVKKIWENEYSDSLNFKTFDPVDYKKGVDEAIDDLLHTIQEYKDYEETGYYKNTQGLNTGDHAYYMEVTAVEDSIVIAKIVGSKNAVYRVRKGDCIYITK